jgi:hypothetical protein
MELKVIKRIKYGFIQGWDFKKECVIGNFFCKG